MGRPVCRRCGDDVVWYRTVAGKPIPLDVGTFGDGNIVIEGGLVVVLKKDDERLANEDFPKHKAHFATCRKGRA